MSESTKMKHLRNWAENFSDRKKQQGRFVESRFYSNVVTYCITTIKIVWLKLEN